MISRHYRLRPCGDHLSLLMVSHGLTLANALGESDGNKQMLQTLRVGRTTYIVSSGVSVRWALRFSMEGMGVKTWRSVGTSNSPSQYGYGPECKPNMKDAVPDDPWAYHDTAAFGAMIAAKGDDEAGFSHASPVTICPAKSTSGYLDEICFGRGVSSKNGEFKPFQFQQVFSRQVFPITIHLNDLMKKSPDTLEIVLRCLNGMKIGGNQASRMASATPEMIAYRFHRSPGQALIIDPPDTSPWAPGNELTPEPLLAKQRALGHTDIQAHLTRDMPYPVIIEKILEEQHARQKTEEERLAREQAAAK